MSAYPPGRGFHTISPDEAEARRQERAAQREREARDAEERTQSIRRYSLAIAGVLFLAGRRRWMASAQFFAGSSRPVRSPPHARTSRLWIFALTRSRGSG